MTRAKDISKIVTDADLSGTLDVTGTVTAGGLTVDAAIPTLQLNDTDGTNQFGKMRQAGANLLVTSRDNTSNGGFRVAGDNGTSETNRFNIASNGDISFYEDTGTTPKLFWDASAESLGIGTTSPSLGSNGTGLHIKGASGDYGVLKIDSSTTSEEGWVQFSNNGVDKFRIASDSSTNLKFIHSGVAERMRIDSSGNVGIGTSSPTAKVDLVDDGVQLRLANSTTGTTTSDGSRIQLSGNDLLLINRESANIQLYTADTERMRITSSGTLLVGKTNTTANVNGIELEASGTIVSTRDNNTNIFLNRRTSDGNLIEFRKDNSTVGNIGVSGANLNIGNGDAGLQFNGGADTIRPWNITSNAARDNAIDLGDPFDRFDDIYATNGTIQTSDRNEKQDIEELSEAEQRVAVVAKGLMRKFRWKDKVAEKGDNARTHFGVIAQDLQDAFTAEGLDAGDYAMFTSNTWTDDDGNEQTRLGVRYNQLLAFIISAI